MARPKGSRGVGGWTMSPKAQVAAGVLSPNDVEKVTQGGVKVTQVKKGREIDPSKLTDSQKKALLEARKDTGKAETKAQANKESSQSKQKPESISSKKPQSKSKTKPTTKSKTKEVITVKTRTGQIKKYNPNNQKQLREAINYMSDEKEIVKLVSKYGDNNLKKAWGLTEEGRRARKESRALMNYVKSDKGQKEAEKLINVYSRQAGFMSKDGNELTMKNLRTVANQDVLGFYGLNK